MEKIEVISNISSPANNDYSHLTGAWTECVNIKELKVRQCALGNAKAIMATPKEHVKRLYIATPCYGMGESEVKKIMDTFS